MEEFAGISPDAAGRVAKLAADNPLYVEELARGIAAEENVLELREVEELAWFLTGLDPEPLPLRDDARHHLAPSAEMVALASAIAIFGKAYLETLGNRAGEGTVNLPKKIKDLVRTRIRKDGRPDEYHIAMKDGDVATVIFTRGLPDEARLALLDLDPTAPELCGKELRWDQAAGTWRPSEALAAELTEAAPD